PSSEKRARAAKLRVARERWPTRGSSIRFSARSKCFPLHRPRRRVWPKRRSKWKMKYLHTMLRVSDIEASLDFFCNKLGLTEVRRRDYEKGRFTLVFLAAPGDEAAQVELTHNWDPEEYTGGRNFGHLAYEVDDIYAICQRLMDSGVTIN